MLVQYNLLHLYNNSSLSGVLVCIDLTWGPELIYSRQQIMELLSNCGEANYRVAHMDRYRTGEVGEH